MGGLCNVAEKYAPLAGRILFAFLFLKNLAIMGVLLMITGMGMRPLSFDNRKSGARGA